MNREQIAAQSHVAPCPFCAKSRVLACHVHLCPKNPDQTRRNKILAGAELGRERKKLKQQQKAGNA